MAQSPHEFAAAAKRHYEDAVSLRREGSFANADHLAGMAAECGLKAILIDRLGGHATGGKPNHTTHRGDYGHLPGLWDQLLLVATGRTGGTFHQLLTGSNPFDRWEIHERYRSGQHIDAARADDHLRAAHQVLSAHQHAHIHGDLP